MSHHGGGGPTPSIGDRGRRLAAVWFCDVVGSTEIAAELGDRRFRWLIARYLAVARSALRRHGGREIDTAGDGMFAIFDAPAAALRAAIEATAAVRDTGLEIRSGVHLGEVEQDPDGRIGGIAVHVGVRVASLAEAGEVLATATTSELASGAGFRFEDRGTHALKGIAGRHAVVAVVEVDGVRAEPPLLADKGLAEALEAQARKVPIPVSIDADSVGRYPHEIEAAVYFCCLEALQNVAKYAGASTVGIRLDADDALLRFEVHDDGAGFDPASTGYGTGLQGMADRLAAVGGSLECGARRARGRR